MKTSQINLRVVALVCASFQHAFSNFAKGAVPAKAETVVQTAGKFHDFLTSDSGKSGVQSGSTTE